MERSKPTETEQRLDRIELAVAQLAAAMRQTVAWRPEQQGQETLARIVREAQERHAAREAQELHRPAPKAPEQREGVTA
jgi:hypothetical protein